jgi:hypothetical protein
LWRDPGADGNWGVHAVVRKKMFRQAAVVPAKPYRHAPAAQFLEPVQTVSTRPVPRQKIIRFLAKPNQH